MNADASVPERDFPIVDPENPWPGLSPFTEDIADYYFGRADAAEDLFRRVKRKPLTILFGLSGLGKTSLLHAGLFPLLRRGGFWPVPIRLDYQPEAPGFDEQVKHIFLHIIHGACLTQPIASGPDESLWQLLHRRGLTWSDADNHICTPVFVFDQFEEIFTLGDSPAIRNRRSSFLHELADLIENRVPATLESKLEEQPELLDKLVFDRQEYRILLSLREDLLARLEGLKFLAPSVMENRERLTQMSGAQALEALLKPGAGLVSLEVARRIVSYVAKAGGAGQTLPVDELGELEVPPPILSLFARRLNDRRRQLHLQRITDELVNESAGEILHTFYEECLADQAPGVRAFVEEDLLTESGFRESMVVEQARKKLEGRGAPASVLDVLIQRRLLQAEERAGVQRVEVTHDVLSETIAKSRAGRRMKEALEIAAEREASLHAALRRQRRRWFAGMLGAATILSFVSALAVFAWIQEGEATRQRNLASEQKVLALEAISQLTYELPERLKNVPGVLSQLRETYEKNLGLLDRILELEGDSPQAMREKMANYNKIGKTWEDLGDTGKAREAYEKARAIIEGLIAQDPGNLQWLNDLAVSHALIGDLLEAQGDSASALDELRKALAIRERLVRAEPENATWQRKLASAHQGLSTHLMTQGNITLARQEVEEALKIAERLVAKNTNDADVVSLTASLRASLAGLMLIQGDVTTAIAQQRAVVAAYKGLLSRETGDVAWSGSLANAHVGLSNMFVVQGDSESALEESRAASDIYERLAKQDPAVVQWRQALAMGHLMRANPLMMKESFDESVQEARAALALFENLAISDPRNADLRGMAAYCRVLIATGLFRQGQVSEALVEARAALKELEDMTKKNPKNVMLVRQAYAGAHVIVGGILGQRGEHMEAVRPLRTGLELFVQLTKREPSNTLFVIQVGNTASLLGHSLVALRQYAESCTVLKSAREVLERSTATPSQLTLIRDASKDVYSKISWACLLGGQFHDAISGALKALEVDPESMGARMNLAHGYLFAGDFERAKALYLQSRSSKLPDGRAFADVVRKDFKELRAVGISKPEMKTIERLLRTGAPSR